MRSNCLFLFLHLDYCLTYLFPPVMNCVPQVVNYWAGYCAAGGLATCLYLGYMQTFFLKSSHLIVVLMALERAVAIVSPFRYPRVWTAVSTLAALAVVFVYAVRLKTCSKTSLTKDSRHE